MHAYTHPAYIHFSPPFKSIQINFFSPLCLSHSLAISFTRLYQQKIVFGVFGAEFSAGNNNPSIALKQSLHIQRSTYKIQA